MDYNYYRSLEDSKPVDVLRHLARLIVVQGQGYAFTYSGRDQRYFLWDLPCLTPRQLESLLELR